MCTNIEKSKIYCQVENAHIYIYIKKHQPINPYIAKCSICILKKLEKGPEIHNLSIIVVIFEEGSGMRKDKLWTSVLLIVLEKFLIEV